MNDTQSLRERAATRGASNDTATELATFETLVAFALVLETPSASDAA